MYLNGVEVNLEKLLRRWNLDDFHKSGDEYNLKCPWQKHRRGQYRVYLNANTGLWHCMSCDDKRGSIVRLVMLMENIGREEALDFLKASGHEINYEVFAEQIAETLYGNATPSRIRKESAILRETKRELRHSTQRSDRFYKERGLSDRSIREWDLHVDNNPRSAYPYIIPIRVDGTPRYIIRRTKLSSVRMKYKYQRGFSRKEVLYGPCKPGLDAQTTILCEGPFDAIMVQQAINESHQEQRYQAVAILGDYISIQQARLVASLTDDVVLFFDNDNGGFVATESCLKNLRGVFISIVDYGKIRAKDPGDLEDYQIMTMIRKAKPALARKVEEIYGS